MTGVLDGIDVLDLSWGVAGPIAGMLLGDNGARVTKIEPPGGDPFRSLSGHRVWNRGKRSAVLDLSTTDDRSVFLALARRADVVIESFAPHTAERLGIGYETLAAANPRIVHCSITGYGDTRAHHGRAGYDALVAARTGQLWEGRGIVGSTICRLAGVEDPMDGLDPPAELWVGPRRGGPLFPGVPWPSLGAATLATIAISGALRAREHTGVGQRVATSLLQGVLVATGMAWQRVEHPRYPAYLSWVVDPRAPKAFFRCADGRWVHQWFPAPAAFFAAAEARLGLRPGLLAIAPSDIPPVSTDIEDTAVLHQYVPAMEELFAQLPSGEWCEIAAAAGFPLQAVRSPEDALADPLLLADGVVTEVADPEVGPIRQVGQTYILHACPTTPPGPAPLVGEHTVEVVREATAAPLPAPPAAAASGATLAAPLEGIVVLDLGLAIAGPYGARLLGDLGADVIKITAPEDVWLSTQFGINCNQGKRSLALNLKHPDGYRILEELVAKADVVHINWRPEAVNRLRLDYETLRRIRPDLVYCQTHGFEQGPRRLLQGNDQMAGALAGTEWLDGGLDHDGIPVWTNYSLGDTGNGLLSAIAVVQALYHRDRTGEGQLVETSIMSAHLLNASFAWASADGSTAGDRPRLDADLLGWSALYRLYETGDGWICLAAVTEDQWTRLAKAIGRDGLADDARFASVQARSANDEALGAILADVFRSSTTRDWRRRLDAAEVPCEETHEDSVDALFDDPELKELGWIVANQHPTAGHIEAAGRYFDLSATPSRVPGPAPVTGQHTAEILAELGYDEGRIEALARDRAVALAR